MPKFCKHCGCSIRDGAAFCPDCGLAVAAPDMSGVEYSYETHASLFPWKAVIPIILLLWLPFTGIGLLVAMAEGFWFVPLIMSGLVFLSVFIVAWANKGKKKRWGVDRTLWVLTPEGYGTGYPPDVAKRLGGLGAASASMTAGRMNWSVTMQGVGMAKNLRYIHGLPQTPWSAFTSAEYRPTKREIALHLPTGQVGIIKANPDNYAYVEQLVRGYMNSGLRHG